MEQADIREALCRGKNPGQTGVLGTRMKTLRAAHYKFVHTPTTVFPAGEFFRLVAGDTHCRDVVACSEGGLQVY